MSYKLNPFTGKLDDAGTSGSVAAAQDGTAALPGISFANDLNTGIYRPGADQLAISTAGTERARIDSSGRLLIGTSSASAETACVITGSRPGYPTGSGDLRLNLGQTPTATTGLGLVSFTADNGSNTAARIIGRRDGGAWTSGSSHPGALVFSTTANGESFPTPRATIDSSGSLLVGTSSAQSFVANVTQTGGIQIAGNSTTPLSIHQFSPNTGAPVISFGKSRSSVVGDHVPVTTNDDLGAILFHGSNGTDFRRGAMILAQVDSGTISSTSMPGRLIFSTTADGASSPTERMRINSSGAIGLSGANFGTAGQVLVSNGSSAAPSWAGVYYNRRPALHRGSLFYKTSATTISITAGSVLNGLVYSAATAVIVPGSFTNNTDYAIWQNPTTGALVASSSFTTAPFGGGGGSIVGGFHYIPSGRPTAFNGLNPVPAEILEYSIWDLTYRPSCPDPRGMACINDAFWIDLYLAGATSYAGTTFSAVPSSKIGLTIADDSSPPLVPAQYGGNGSTNYGSFTWYEASEMAASFGKRLPFYAEFAAAAYGAPEATSRGSDPGTVIWERASKFGLAQATGVMWQWARETCTSDPPTAWQTGVTEGRGDVYGPETRALLLGGSWNLAFYPGSRCANWNDTPWFSYSLTGARFCSNHLVLG